MTACFEDAEELLEEVDVLRERVYKAYAVAKVNEEMARMYVNFGYVDLVRKSPEQAAKLYE